MTVIQYGQSQFYQIWLVGSAFLDKSVSFDLQCSLKVILLVICLFLIIKDADGCL